HFLQVIRAEANGDVAGPATASGQHVQPQVRRPYGDRAAQDARRLLAAALHDRPLLDFGVVRNPAPPKFLPIGHEPFGFLGHQSLLANSGSCSAATSLPARRWLNPRPRTPLPLPRAGRSGRRKRSPSAPRPTSCW